MLEARTNRAGVESGRARTGAAWRLLNIGASTIGDLAALWLAAHLAGLSASATLVFTLAATTLVAGSGAHPGRLALRVGADLPVLATRIPIAVLAATPVGLPAASGQSLLVAALAGLALAALGRFIVYGAIRRIRSVGFGLEPVVIVGAGPVATGLATTLLERPEYGLRPIGFVDDSPTGHLPLPRLGGPRDLPDIVDNYQLTHAILAFGPTREASMLSAIRACDARRVRFHVLPRFFELGTGGRSRSDDLWGLPVDPIKRSLSSHHLLPVKRTVDIAVSAILLILALPAMAACALAVRLTSPGPIFYRQKRVGRNGQVFEILKFRSLYENDDGDTTWTADDTDLVTPAGRFLRPTHLDELPQLLNVLKGDMSLVGPRPMRPYFVDRFTVEIDRYNDRHRVKGGLTGLAQVNGLSGDSSVAERARFDNHYIEHWSVWRDLEILVRTVPTLFSKER